ncbi:MAG TPA: sigma-54 dependent transcriptional regulator, partial [Acidobacteriota bacterium]|nr:sigma-54 dependent transcriptional regulator [Acidobacteriota bacterium]
YLADHYQVFDAEDASSAFQQINNSQYEVVLLDLSLPEVTGTEVLQRIRQEKKDIPVIMLTAVDRIAKVVECIKLGAFDYLTKPVIAEELIASIERAVESTEMRRELDQRRKLQLESNREYELIGQSVATATLRKQIETVARTDSPVLLLGETGTGKELTARQIHNCSPRAAGPFVAINCAALPRDLVEAEFFGHKKGSFTGAATSEIGKFQLAHGGTLLLDEIGDLPLEAQSKILRVLEEKQYYPIGSNEIVRVDVRIIASTNRNLKAAVREKAFREDLYFRLNVYTIEIPPLSDRPEDILSLAEHFLHFYNTRFSKDFAFIEPEAAERLLEHPWKGNVRELRNLIERVVLSEEGPVLKKDHLRYLDTSLGPDPSDGMFQLTPKGIDLEELEKRLILQALALANGNKAKAARLLRLSPPTLYYRLEKYGIH